MIKKIILLLAIVGPFGLYFLYSWLKKLENKKIPIAKLSIASIILLVLVLKILHQHQLFELHQRTDDTHPFYLWCLPI